MKKYYLLSILIILSFTGFSQKKTMLDNQVNIVFGVGQILSNGFNIEGNFAYKRLIFDYSHGFSLNIANSALENGNDKDQKLAIHIPWTTGFGVGYRFNDWLNLRVEPKWHKFELYQEGATQNNDNLLGEYSTFTLGLGLYANIKPFKNKDNLLKGIMIAPNFRWWPRVSSTLNNDKLTYFNTFTQQEETHEAREIGMANTPFFFNISIGYSLQF